MPFWASFLLVTSLLVKVSIPYRYSTNKKFRTPTNALLHVSNPYRYSTNCITMEENITTLPRFQTLIGILQTHWLENELYHFLYDRFQTLIGILQTTPEVRYTIDYETFQTLIGILQTWSFQALQPCFWGFQTLIGILQTPQAVETLLSKEFKFQTLIGILQTALFLALFKLLSSF